MQSREITQMLELKLVNSDIGRNNQNESHLTLNITDKEDQKLECWSELKVKDRFINKRSYHATVIYNSKLYIYGGQDLNIGIYSDFNFIQLNEDLNLSHWEPVLVKGKMTPGPLSRMISVIEENKWYLFGGTTSATENTSKLWEFDFFRGEWALVKPNSVQPPPLDSHSGILYKNAQGKTQMIVFGGFVGGRNGEYWNQVIRFDFLAKQWTLPYKDGSIQMINPAGPPPRGGHTAVLHDNSMYIFGGTNGEFRFNDVWKYDLVKDIWHQIKPKLNPPPRNGHTSLVYNDNGFLVFGGIQDITHEKDDLLFFNFITNQWVILDGELDIQRSPAVKNNDRLPETLKFERSNRGKSLTESPGKMRSSPFKDSRNNSKAFDQFSPSKRTTSPGIRKDRSPRKSNKPLSNNSFGLSQTEFKSTASPNFTRTYQGLSRENEEKKKKLFLVRKQNFLREFEVSDPKEALTLIVKSPTTEAMRNSIIAINYKGYQPELEVSPQSQSPSPLKSRKKQVSLFSELVGESFIKVKIPINGKVNGRKPCARDGHSAVIYGNKMLVFGGDRHKMSFNDIYMLNINQILNPSEKEAL